MLSVTPTRRELLVWLLAALLMVTAIVTWRGNTAEAGGPTQSTPIVYIATGLNFPDALAASSPAALGLGPILLVQQNAIPQPTLDELNRLQPADVFIMGGTSAISQAVEDAIEALSFSPDVTRIAGNNRYETAAELSQAVFPTSGKYPRVSYQAGPDTEDGAAGVPFDPYQRHINAPYDGYLVVQASADFSRDAADAVVSCWLWLDANTNPEDETVRFSRLTATNNEEDCATFGVITVAAGDHTVGFRVSQDADVNILAGGISIIWIPFGSVGQIPAIP